MFAMRRARPHPACKIQPQVYLPRMSVIQSMPGHLIRRLQQISVSIFQDHMQGLGLDLTPVQFATLSALRETPGVDQATLAGLVAHDRVTLSGVLNRLVSRGLVERRVNPHDRRARRLALTAAGEALLSRALPEVLAAQRDMLAGLDEAERATFMTLARKLTETNNDRSRAPLRPPD